MLAHQLVLGASCSNAASLACRAIDQRPLAESKSLVDDDLHVMLEPETLGAFSEIPDVLLRASERLDALLNMQMDRIELGQLLKPAFLAPSAEYRVVATPVQVHLAYPWGGRVDDFGTEVRLLSVPNLNVHPPQRFLDGLICVRWGERVVYHVPDDCSNPFLP